MGQQLAPAGWANVQKGALCQAGFEGNSDLVGRAKKKILGRNSHSLKNRQAVLNLF